MQRSLFRIASATLLAFAAFSTANAKSAMTQGQVRTLGREVFQQLIEIDTTNEHGATTPAAQAVAKRFLDAGVAAADVQVLGASDKHQNVVVRLRGAGKREPVLLLAHLDVVEAKREDWTLDPFAFTEKDGYFYGRGTQDIKSGAANLVTTLLRMKHDGVVPRGDLIMALTAGEESGVDNGVEWLLAHQRALIEAPVCFNQDGGGGEIHDGKRTLMAVQTAEKVFTSFTLTVHNAGGHSSQPRPDNAIYRLATALTRLSTLAFPSRSSETTRGYFAAMAELSEGDLARDLKAAAQPGASAADLDRLVARGPLYNAQLRTTCTPTMLNGGHAENALPQLATALINCRMLPDEDPASVERAIVAAVADPEIEVKRTWDPKPSPASPVAPAVMKAIVAAMRPTYGDLPAVPYMDTGASDGLFLRGAGMPVYAFGSFFLDIDDVRAHGRDERIPVAEYYDGLDFTYRLLRNW